MSVAYKNAVGSRRAAWRIITSVEQKEKSKGNDGNAGFAKEYCGKVEAELDKICNTILKLLDDKLISNAGNGESKVFYQKMKADYYRYIAESMRVAFHRLSLLAGANKLAEASLEVAVTFRMMPVVTRSN